MKAQRIKRYLIVILLLGFSGSGGATPHANPFPGIWSDDVDGKGLFNHGNLAFSAEIFALPEKFLQALPIPGKLTKACYFAAAQLVRHHAAFSTEHR